MKEISEFTQRVVNRDLMRWPALSWITRRINIVLFMLIRICTYIYILIDAVAWQQSVKEKIIVKRERKKMQSPASLSALSSTTALSVHPRLGQSQWECHRHSYLD